MRFIDLTGNKYGMLTVLGLSGLKNKKKELIWNCQCDCGKIKQSMHVKSCGCFIGGYVSLAKTIHGDRESKEYKVWKNMKSRCLNPKNIAYKNYGGRGIKICDKWIDSYEYFLLDMGRIPKTGLTIDRIDNNSNYEPGNCRWATREEQSYNKRNNIFINDGNEVLTQFGFCKKYNLSRRNFYGTLKRNDFNFELTIQKIKTRKRRIKT